MLQFSLLEMQLKIQFETKFQKDWDVSIYSHFFSIVRFLLKSKNRKLHRFPLILTDLLDRYGVYFLKIIELTMSYIGPVYFHLRWWSDLLGRIGIGPSYRRAQYIKPYPAQMLWVRRVNQIHLRNLTTNIYFFNYNLTRFCKF